MQRRRFLIGSGIALGGALGTAGCFGSATGSPPRETKVFDSIQASAAGIRAELEDPPLVQSRQDLSNAIGRPSTGNLADLGPVGVARGQEQTVSDPRGSGEADAAPKGRNGRAKWRGGGYQEWWEKNSDDVNVYEASVVSAGFFYYGSTDDFRNQLTGPGPLDWNFSVNDVEGDTVAWGIDTREGWYRVGIRLERGDFDLGWEAVDFEVRETDLETATPGNETERQGSEPTFGVVTQWKVSPNL